MSIEMTLEEWVRRLPLHHRAVQEYRTLVTEERALREFVEWLYIATADGTLSLDTPAILDMLQCRSAEVLGEERAEELLDALNREE